MSSHMGKIIGAVVRPAAAAAAAAAHSTTTLRQSARQLQLTSSAAFLQSNACLQLGAVLRERCIADVYAPQPTSNLEALGRRHR